MALEPIDRAVATDDPEIAAKIVQDTTVATPRPPRMWPITVFAMT